MDEFEYLIILVLIMLFVAVIMDIFSLYMVKSGSVDIEDYAVNVLNWFKVVLFGVFGIVLLYYAFTTSASPLMIVAEFVVGILVIADCIIGAIVKIKYGKKK
ncbi:MAG: hypothetical protein J6K17_07820 [Oscillospiraceae bacterium]|nr:hypothetical protein [Oscillospiraceae bacterium]